jgi:hypothetical protein
MLTMSTCGLHTWVITVVTVHVLCRVVVLIVPATTGAYDVQDIDGKGDGKGDSAEVLDDIDQKGYGKGDSYEVLYDDDGKGKGKSKGKDKGKVKGKDKGRTQQTTGWLNRMVPLVSLLQTGHMDRALSLADEYAQMPTISPLVDAYKRKLE